MLKIYKYFLFRIYHFYVNTFKENQIPVFYVGAVSSLILGFTLRLIYGYFELIGFVPSMDTSYSSVAIIFIIWGINYYLFVRDKEFLKKGFKNDVLGGVLIVAYIVLLIVLLIVKAEIKRARL
jgi:hypothetical protein